MSMDEVTALAMETVEAKSREVENRQICMTRIQLQHLSPGQALRTCSSVIERNEA